MDKQKEIVETLDLFYEQIERNTQSIKAYERIKKGIVWANTINCTNMKKLGDICELKIGGTPRRNINEYWNNGSNVWVSISDLNNNIIYNSKEKITDEGVKNSNVKLLKKGTILMSFKMSLGKKGIAGVNLYTNEAIVGINPLDSEKILGKYIYYMIDKFDFSQACSSIATGNMNKDKLENIQIPVPSSQVQESIVKECEYWDEQIDRLKKENEKLKAVPVIELCLASESADSTKQSQLENAELEVQDESNDENQDPDQAESESESDE